MWPARKPFLVYVYVCAYINLPTAIAAKAAAVEEDASCFYLFADAKLNFDISFWRINIFARGGGERSASSSSWRDEALLITRGFSGY
jgi:hypothetical protein